MTASKTFVALLARLTRTVTRTLRNVAFKSATLTVGIPGFVKLEIKAEADAKPAKSGRHQPA